VTDLHILRKHSLGLTKARKIAFQWAEKVENKFGMTCTYEEGAAEDEVRFTRSGVQGRMSVTQNKFEINVQLGFFLDAFRPAIEREIMRNLDHFLEDMPRA